MLCGHLLNQEGRAVLTLLLQSVNGGEGKEGHNRDKGEVELREKQIMLLGGVVLFEEGLYVRRVG